MKLSSSDEYLSKLSDIVFSYFPDKKILLNSPGRLHIRKILKFISKYKDGKKTNAFVLGYDYYYQTDFRDKFFLSKILDNIDLGFPLEISISSIYKKIKVNNIGFEVTEAQMEAWGKNKIVGNSSKELKYMILKVSSVFLKFTANNRLVIRL